MPTVKIETREEWEEYTDGMETVVDSHIVDKRRWLDCWECIVKSKEGKFYRLYWESGSTEQQYMDFEYCYHAVTEVEPFEAVVIKYREKK